MAILSNQSWPTTLALVACMLAPVLAAGCNFEQRDWERTQATNTIEAYAAFIEKHPQGQLADLARKEIEQREWKLAESSNTIGAYQAFVGKHPSGEHVGTATKAIDLLERRAKLDAILTKRDVDALRTFVADGGNDGVLNRFKTAEGGTLTLTSQPEDAIKGYRAQVAVSKKAGSYDVSLVVPSGAKVNVKPFGFSDGTNFKIAKGAVRIAIVDGKLAPGTAAGELKLALTLKDVSVLKLASEYTDIAPNVLLHVSDSELVVTRADEAILQRDLSKPAPGTKGIKFSVTKGNLYLLTLP